MLALKDELLWKPFTLAFCMDEHEIDKLVGDFLDTETIEELSKCLGVKYNILTYYLYIVKEEARYNEFEISKRSGGTRKIIAPITPVKFIQSNLNEILQKIFIPKNSVHGFTLGKSIKSNATAHLKKRIVVNIDLKDFFPTINFGRVRGLFLAYPFNFNEVVATALAQICCYKNTLPQGAPTSPIISNFICRRLDNEITKLLSQKRCTYTRYADDITISTNLKSLPTDIATIVDDKLRLGESVIQIIKNNGFQINASKTRYAYKNNRQEVTGLIVNKTVNVNRKYVRHVRAMLHSWEKYGITNAAQEHFSKYNVKHKKITHPENSYQNELVGKIGFIGFIKGKSNPIYRKLVERLNKVAPEVRLRVLQNEIEQETYPIVYGEGKTDWKHLKKALEVFKKNGFYQQLFLKFHENEMNFSNDQLLGICKTLPNTDYKQKKVICLFDRDVKSFNSKITENGNLYKHWGKDVYSLLMPKPSHRTFEEVCIEHYYRDEDLKKIDSKRRRIYLSDEFDKIIGNHLKENLNYKYLNYLKANYPRIIDYGVLNSKGENVALSKNDFAEHILNGTPPFNEVSFEHFKLIFDEIEKIINIH